MDRTEYDRWRRHVVTACCALIAALGAASSLPSHAHARYLSGVHARFLSVDPILLRAPQKVLETPQHLNAYTYAMNSPLVVSDPTGEEAIVLHGGFVGGPSGVEGLAQRVGELIAKPPPAVQTPVLRPSVTYEGGFKRDDPWPGVKLAHNQEHSPGTQRVLAGFSIGGDAALRAGGPKGGGQWDLRVVVGARVRDDFVKQLIFAAGNSKQVVVVGLRGDRDLANDRFVPSAVGSRFGDRSFEAITAAIDAHFGSVADFRKQYPNVSIQPADGAHGDAGNRQATLDAVQRGYEELNGPGP